MSATFENKGTCLCQAVGIHAQGMSNELGACHCSMCRKWAGGPFMGVDCGTQVTFQGEDKIAVFDSSGWAERGFCKQCGTHLFYRLKANGQYIVPAGLFDQGAAFVFDHQVFIDEKPAYYSFANETKNMTGAEVFAMYAPPD